MFWSTVRARITDELLARRIDRWFTSAIAALLVAFGFVLGRWSSLTTTETPIVFQEAPGGESSIAKPVDLRALVAGQGTTADEETPAEEASRSPGATARPATAGAATTRSTDEGGALGVFVASVNGKKYYRPSCKEVNRIKEENRIWFDSEEEARESGYEPSVCVKQQ